MQPYPARMSSGDLDVLEVASRADLPEVDSMASAPHRDVAQGAKWLFPNEEGRRYGESFDFEWAYKIEKGRGRRPSALERAGVCRKVRRLALGILHQLMTPPTKSQPSAGQSTINVSANGTSNGSAIRRPASSAVFSIALRSSCARS